MIDQQAKDRVARLIEVTELENRKARTRFSFADPLWSGLAKVNEEAGEATQVFGKLVINDGEQMNWDGRDLLAMLLEETADLQATLDFFLSNSTIFNGSNRKEVREQWQARRLSKLAKFEQYRDEELAAEGHWSYDMFCDLMLYHGFTQSMELTNGQLFTKELKDRTLVVGLNSSGEHTIGHTINNEARTAPQTFRTYQDFVAAFNTEKIRRDHPFFEAQANAQGEA